jgi:two-component system response regulator AtoC
VGKDLIARVIHYESRRADAPFMTITCTTLQETLLESELFGHEKGSFTDARTQKSGLFELADGGTVFLDEIGDMGGGLQAKLLRFLEEKTFRRVGGTKDIRVDVRVVAATNRNLEEMIQQGKFREDLYYRLNVMPIDLPPLRTRRDDVPALAGHFIRHFNRDFKKDVKGLTPNAESRLQQYDWPGNVRELRNVIERAMLLCLGDTIEIDDLLLRSPLEGAASGNHKAALRFPDEGVRLEEVERWYVEEALRKTHGNQSQAARLLGISRDQIRYRMKQYGLRGAKA